MVRKEQGQHKFQTALADNPAKDVSRDEWNDDHDKTGMQSNDSTTATITISAGGALLVTDTLTIVAANSGVTDDLANITTTNMVENDILLLMADTGDTITVKDAAGGAGQVHLNGDVDRDLTQTTALWLIRRGADLYEYNLQVEFSDALFTLHDDGDATKKALFQLSGITTATTRTYTLQDVSDTLAVLGSNVYTGRQQFDKGADVASADEVVLGSDGNYFDVTGAVAINHIRSLNWQPGSHITLQFDSTPTVNHNTGGEAGDEASIILIDAENRTMVAGDTLSLVLDSATKWREYGERDISPIGTQTIWADSAAWIVPPTTTPAEFATRETTTNKIPLAALKFDTTTSEVAWLRWTPPPNWNAGTIRFRLWWTNSAGLTTETIDFDLAGVAFANDDALDTAVGTTQNVTDTWIAQNDAHLTAYSTAITIAGTPVAGELVYLKLSRDVVADNLTGDAEVLGLEIEYTLDAATAT